MVNGEHIMNLGMTPYIHGNSAYKRDLFCGTEIVKCLKF
jgi:hypothetical protein